MKKKEKRKKRWIVFNAGKKIRIPIEEPTFLLYPYNQRLGVSYDENRLMLQLVRPPCRMKKKLGRYCKDKVYAVMAAHCAKANIIGSFAGLAANYMPEIFVNFAPFIKGKFYNIEINKQSYEELVKYTEFIIQAFPIEQFKVDFEVRHADIIKELHNLEEKISILDLDLMESLGKKHSIDKVINGINVCAADKLVLALWQTSGRNGWTNEEINNKIRPKIRSSLSKYFTIDRYDIIDYWEGYPMRCDIYTIHRKHL